MTTTHLFMFFVGIFLALGLIYGTVFGVTYAAGLELEANNSSTASEAVTLTVLNSVYSYSASAMFVVGYVLQCRDLIKARHRVNINGFFVFGMFIALSCLQFSYIGLLIVNGTAVMIPFVVNTASWLCGVVLLSANYYNQLKPKKVETVAVDERF